ncbi:hypothetical protein QR680_000514 [Steinernema hermaphroditum]|uniref:Uncharacterized protein n=1 Tax=Steinernema hermaphroditum TaxID=289476 RepID=A0AA39LE81_9BILA|nr:hypothetical protein QR680_000514 [Steinernema hermaphroditum]
MTNARRIDFCLDSSSPLKLASFQTMCISVYDLYALLILLCYISVIISLCIQYYKKFAAAAMKKKLRKAVQPIPVDSLRAQHGHCTIIDIEGKDLGAKDEQPSEQSV